MIVKTEITLSQDELKTLAKRYIEAQGYTVVEIQLTGIERYATHAVLAVVSYNLVTHDKRD